MRVAETQLRNDASINLNIEGQAISNAVERFHHLPVSLANHPGIIELLRAEDEVPEQWLTNANLYLETLSDAAGTSLLYVINSHGLTRSSSNWRSDQSLVGNNYLFRPYFQDAMIGQEARYFAVGVTTGESGYYFARPIAVQRKILGVAVAKIELETLQRQWLEKSTPSLLLDEHGVIIMASEARWRFRSTRQLSTNELNAFTQQRKYAQHKLDLLTTEGSLDSSRTRLDGKLYLINKKQLALQNWQLLQLTPYAPVYKAGLVSLLMSILLIGSSVFGYLYQRERRRKMALKTEAMDAATMRTLNKKLQAEIGERKKAEEELKNTQAELIQASKLAALGQMSTAVAHEVNQPLSAIRTFSASAKLLLERRRYDEVFTNLDKIKTLTERLAVLTSDLKTFARKTDHGRDLVSLQECIVNVHSILDGELRERQIGLSMDLPEHPVRIMARSVRIEQVISNLIRNAMDATEENQQKGIIKLSLSLQGHNAVLHVLDNGPGLSQQTIDRVFEPFFTTKPVGKGVGLGLAISYGIVEELNGQLSITNHDEGGALLTVCLPIPEGYRSSQ